MRATNAMTRMHICTVLAVPLSYSWLDSLAHRLDFRLYQESGYMAIIVKKKKSIKMNFSFVAFSENLHRDHHFQSNNKAYHAKKSHIK